MPKGSIKMVAANEVVPSKNVLLAIINALKKKQKVLETEKLDKCENE